jgi:predicted membrane protein
MSNESRATFRLTPQVVLGLCIVAFGVALTVDNLGYADASQILAWWPLGIVLVGVIKLFQSSTGSGRVVGGVITFVGVALLGEMLDVFRIWAWWPVALIAMGLVIVFRALGGSRPGPAAPGSAALTPGGSPAAMTGESRLSELAIWSGVQRRVSSPVFRHADLTAVMGGIELDLRQAGTGGGEAVIDVFVMWGGIEITVPPDWAVSNQVVPIMGGAEDKSTGTQTSQNRLILRGVAIMGGVEIKT